MPIRSQRMGIEDILTGESTGRSRDAGRTRERLQRGHVLRELLGPVARREAGRGDLVFKQEPVTFEPGAPLDILMENMGRVNFGPMMEHQHKGIKDCVQINGHMHYNWTMYPLPLGRREPSCG